MGRKRVVSRPPPKGDSMAGSAPAGAPLPAESLGFRGRVQQLLTSTLSELVASASVDLALLHYYWGNHEERGAVRMSVVTPQELQGGRKSVDVFQWHLRQFGPHLSLLRWAYFFALKGHKAAPIQVIRFEMIDGGAAIERCKTKGLALHLTYSKELADRLCPEDLRKKHALNLLSERGSTDLRKAFAIALGHAKGLLGAEGVEIAAELGRALPGMERAEAEASVLNFLTALQSARAFLDSVVPNHVGPPHVMDFHCLFASEDDLPPSSTLFTLHQSAGDPETAAVQTRLGKLLENVSKEIDRGVNDLPSALDYLVCDRVATLMYQDKARKQPRPEWEHAFSLLDSRFPLPRFGVWRDCVLTWISSLICHLRAKYHEGEKLEFWLAAGDRAEVLDSGRFELRGADSDHLATVAVPPHPGPKTVGRFPPRGAFAAIDSAREAAVRVASKENYVWFANGRYALFWDLTSLGRDPIGLLRPTDGNWEWYLEQREKEAGSERWPELLLAFERRDGSGGIVIGAEPVTRLAEQGKRVELVQRWIGDWRGEAHIMSNEVDALLSALIVQIADSDAGCAVVFASATPSDRFMKMGYPWRLWEPMLIEEPARDEIRRFMQMDGATCVWFDAASGKWKIDFQFLLHGDQTIISQWIPKVKNNHKLRLRGAGARRWSAAVAASHSIVGLVVVASQDGEIYGFRKRGNGELQMIEIASRKPGRVEDGSGASDAGGVDEPKWETLIEGQV